MKKPMTLAQLQGSRSIDEVSTQELRELVAAHERYARYLTEVLTAPTKTYIIAHSDYMGVDPDIYEFSGTWRQLLEDLNGVTDENRNDLIDEDDPSRGTIADVPDDELVKLFQQANGDGQPDYQVWCVDDHKKVLP